MVLELHIWGPAYGLPSIDAQCLAAVAYLNQALPQGEWVLIASSDPAICPNNELPALKNGSTWVSKFSNIVNYLRQYSAGQWDLDEDLDAIQRAELTAYTSFIESRGQPLLDLFLFVSTENYVTATRPAYAEMLQWPSQWITPPNIRAVARKRSDHLGLSSLDVDSAAQETAPASSEVSKNLIIKSRETLTSVLGQSSHKNQFKLEGLTTEFYEPLAGLLDEKRYLLTDDHLCSLDCLATGYLSLIFYPTLPHEWTKAFMQAKFPQIVEYTKQMAGICYALPTSIQDAFPVSDPESSAQGAKGEKKLPWQAPSKPSLSAIAGMIFTSVTDSIPVVSQLRADRQLRGAAQDPELVKEHGEHLQAIARARTRETYSQIAAVGTVLGLFASYCLYEGIIELPWRAKEEESERRDFGEAGAMLGL
ncbi:putative mitochondrial import receptor subunit [Phaeomoniella chlamydospora]|uniref:Putative mitochondrial import receptor subunit n=1 Tax=Phaeomoniella chlamydospora TaxID=158046 RepID=A0A0G2H9B4_PHACM|nr:putative mitochondrial import receptor subunit [Phaeomoniella chlamydospora]